MAMCGVLALGVVCLSADDLSIQVDPQADFSRFKTFSIRDGKIDSPRPELDNPLFVKKLGTTIRDALKAKGLTATADRPDLLVDFSLKGEDISLGVPSAARGLGPQPRGAGPPPRGLGPQPLRFTEGTLVIDLTRPGEQAPVWRGMYRDDEGTGSKLMQKLPEDAKKLIDRYPPLSRTLPQR